MAPTLPGEGGAPPTYSTTTDVDIHAGHYTGHGQLYHPNFNPNPMNQKKTFSTAFSPATVLRQLPGFRIHTMGRSPFWAQFVLLFFLMTGSYFAQAQCELSCKKFYPVILDAVTGEVEITPELVLNNYPDPDCPGTVLITVSTMQGEILSNTLDCSRAGDTLMIVGLHLLSNNSCWGSIIVTDDFAPLLDCPDVFVACTDSLLPHKVGYPDWSENCTVLADSMFSFTDLYTYLPCSTIVNSIQVTGNVVRTWSVADASGNVGTCQQTIWLRTGTVGDIVFPLDRDGFAAPALKCGQDVKNLKLTGEPTIDGYPVKTLGYCDFQVDYTDQSNPECVGGAYQTLRTWRVIDYCHDTIIYRAQLIRSIDDVAPTIKAPNDITIGTSAKTCDAPVSLPTSWTASDSCSTFQVNVQWAYGTGYGPFLKIPMGQYEVYYEAQDACGNIGRDTMMVTIIDDVKPTAVCKKDVNIALPSSGIITVPASLFDDGSYDNCALDRLEVSKNNAPFSSHATFMCADIGKQVMVVLKAIDHLGLSNTCMMIVLIQDKLPPTISCPNDITVACTTDIKNLSITGAANGTDNCQMKSVTYADTKFLNQCLTGYINRLWTAEDVYGNKSGCLQVITQRDTTPIQIIWPVNFSSYTCGQNTTPAVTGQPIITGYDCENLFVTYVDKEFKTAFPACYKIERCWEVRDWCTFDANKTPNPGFWQFVQYIDIIDTIAPVLQVPPDITIGTTETDCHGVLNIPAATVTDCNPNTKIFNNSPYANAPGASINGIYPIGVHQIMFTALDGCGNSSMAFMKVTVKDDKPPLAICNNGVTIGLNMDGVAILPVTLIDNHSNDNCTSFQGLQFSIFPYEFSCDSLGPHEVTLTVIDALGNSNTCKTIVIVQDNLGICPGSLQPELGGKIINAMQVPVNKVDVWLNSLDMVKTDMQGTFFFKDLDEGSTYTVTPELDQFHLNGITVADLLLIQKHILGIQPLSAPYVLMAADVNRSGQVTIADIIEIRKMLLGSQQGFNNAPSWVFVDKTYKFKNPNKPHNEPFPQSIVIQDIHGKWTGQDFIAVKMGDVNYSASPANILEAETRNAFIAELEIEDILMTPGYTYEVPVRIKSDIPLIGFQWQMSIDDASGELLSVMPADCPSLHAEMIHNTQYDVRTVWHSITPDSRMETENIILLSLRVNKPALLSDVLKINHAFNAIAIDKYGEEGSISVRYHSAIQHTRLLTNSVWPNPFTSATTYQFDLDQPMQVRMNVIDATGRKVWTHQADYTQGSHQVTIPGETLGRSGIYKLIIETPQTRPVDHTLILLDE